MRNQPLYRSVAEQIERKIFMGDYDANEPLPSEPQLEKQFQVSRITVRQAISLLKQRGLIKTHSGKGTVIRKEVVERESLGVRGFINDLIYYSARTEYTPIDTTLVKPDKHVGSALGVPSDGYVVRMTGVRRLNSAPPFVAEEFYCTEKIAQGIENKNLYPNSVFRIVEEQHSIKITEVRQEMYSSKADSFSQKHLDIPHNHCVLNAIRYYRSHSGDIIIVTRSRYDTSSFRYVTTLFSD